MPSRLEPESKADASVHREPPRASDVDRHRFGSIQNQKGESVNDSKGICDLFGETEEMTSIEMELPASTDEKGIGT